jgi:hypothetical protein
VRGAKDDDVLLVGKVMNLFVHLCSRFPVNSFLHFLLPPILFNTLQCSRSYKQVYGHALDRSSQGFGAPSIAARHLDSVRDISST